MSNNFIAMSCTSTFTFQLIQNPVMWILLSWNAPDKFELQSSNAEAICIIKGIKLDEDFYPHFTKLCYLEIS